VCLLWFLKTLGIHHSKGQVALDPLGESRAPKFHFGGILRGGRHLRCELDRR
jgi:hypothetical protein